MNKETQEKQYHEFLNWLKQSSFEVYKEFLLKKQKAYQEDIARMLRMENCDLAKVRIAQALSDNITLVLTTHINSILNELKPLDQVDDTQIY